MLKELTEAPTLGVIYGLGPCTISCAPLIVPLIMSTAQSKKQGVIFSLIFSIGRVFSYTVLGFLAGLLGYTLQGIVSRKTLGIFLLILGTLLLFRINKKCILKSGMRINSPFLAFVTGVVYGFTPCPQLIALLALAVISNSALVGALMALVFGIGTIISPIIIIGFFSAWFAKKKEMQEVIPYVSGIFLIMLGIIYLLSK